MGGVCQCCSWTCRSLWSVVIILAAEPFVLHCLESPAAAVGKVYPRGSHWAVGHLMGKKSIERLPELQEENIDSDYLTSSETAGVKELNKRYEHLMEALMQPKNQKQMVPQTADRLLQLHSSWRDEDREKYFREISDLLLLALKLQDSDTT